MPSSKKILALIPARYASTRFPGKPLVEIAGKTMIQRTYERVASLNCWDQILIATDDARIFDAAKGFGAQVCMTASHHVSGTDRCAEVLATLQDQPDYVVNIQGDEPFIEPKQLEELVASFEENPEIVTLVKSIDSQETLLNINSPKVVLDQLGYALYFSRHPVPFVRGLPQEDWLQQYPFYKHIGLYAYRADVLRRLAQLSPSPLERAESLEQLRWLEHGFRIRCLKTQFETIGVDTPDDLHKIQVLGLI